MNKGYKTTIIHQEHEPTNADVLNVALQMVRDSNYTPDYIRVYSKEDGCWVTIALKDLQACKKKRLIVENKLKRLGICVK